MGKRSDIFESYSSQLCSFQTNELKLLTDLTLPQAFSYQIHLILVVSLKHTKNIVPLLLLITFSCASCHTEKITQLCIILYNLNERAVINRKSSGESFEFLV